MTELLIPTDGAQRGILVPTLPPIVFPESSYIPDINTREGAEFVTKMGREYPDYWMEQFLGCDQWTIPKLIARAVFNSPRVAVASCDATSKSYNAARIALAFLYIFSPATVITTAPTFRQVEHILWREIGEAWMNALVELGGSLHATSINIHKKWFALGLSTDEPVKFQGMHNVNVLVVGDEAAGLPTDVYSAMENPLSSGNAHQLLIGNPDAPVGDFRDTFDDPAFVHFHISCFDTPNFTAFGITIDDMRNNTWEEKIAGRPLPRPYLITPEWVYGRFVKWGESNILFLTHCLGQFPESGTNTFISRAIVRAAMNDVKLTDLGKIVVASLDVSRFGEDLTVFMARRGGKIIRVESWTHQDTTFTGGKTARLLDELKPIACRVDVIGVGAGVVDNLNNNGYGCVEGYNSGDEALEKEFYGNARAEHYFGLARKLERLEIELPQHPELEGQLCDLRYRYNDKNQLFIESKEAARKRGAKSPDFADALCMLFKPVRATPGGGAQQASYGMGR